MSDPDVKTIFGRALEMASPLERSNYLDSACAGNAALRAEVDALMAAADKAGSFLNRPAADPNVVEPTVLTNTISERPGSVIGPYKLLQQIGEGGFGVVYMAEQETPVRRTVALKIIKPGMDSREVIARFEAERQALALMDHQNIARVLDAGATETGRPYFVMELVKGIPITEYCNNHRLTPRERLELFVPVCHAIQHAHQKGIIHRDIKPSNVLVCLYDGKPVPKVIDFGVAKAIEQRLTEKTMFTRHGQVVGTLEYMSPEQAELSQLDIDTRSDVYSLGVLLYELLTGTTPITKDQLRKAGFTEMLRMIRETEPDRPSLRLSHSHDTLASISAQRRTEPAKLGALLKGELDWLVMKALEKDRTRRYETASSLARDIERYLNDETVEACPPSMGYRLSKVLRRHRRSVIAGSLLALFLVVVLINHLAGYFALKKARAIAWEQANRAKLAESDALQNLEMARKEQQRAEDAERAAQNDRDRAVAAEQRAAEQRDLAVAAEQEAVRQRALEAKTREEAQSALARSLFEQARAVRLAGQPGRRWRALELLTQSETIRRQSSGSASPEAASSALPNRPELRSEVVSALLTRDGRAVHHRPGFAHSISPDGKFASSTWLDRDLKDGGLTIIDLKSGKQVRQFDGKGAEAMQGVMHALGPNAERLAVVSTNMRQISVWRVSDQSKLTTLTVPRPAELATDGQDAKPRPSAPQMAAPRQLAFSPNGRYLVGAFNRGTPGTDLVLWDIEGPPDGRTVATCRSATAVVAISPDSQRLAFAPEPQQVTVWNIAEERAETEIELPLRTDGGLGFHPSGQSLAVHCQDGSKWKLLFWDIPQNREVSRLETGALSFITPVRYSPDGRYAAISGVTGAVTVYDLTSSSRTGEHPPIRLDHGMMPQLLAWSADGQLLTGSLGGLKQWEFATAEAVTLLPLDGDDKVSRLAFSPDGNIIAAVDLYASKVLLFERRTGKAVRSWRSGLSYEASSSLHYSPDGKQLVRSSPSGLIVWDPDTGEERLRVASAGLGISSAFSVGFRSDGAVLAAGMDRSRPKVWVVGTGQSLWEPSSKKLGKLAAVSPNGRFAVAYRAFALDGDLSIPVWDLEKGQLRFELAGPVGTSYQSLADISPDNRWILALHYGGDVTKSFPRGTSDTRPPDQSPAAPQQFVPPNPVRVTFGSEMSTLLAPDEGWIGDVWNAETGQRHLQIFGPSAIEYYVFSPNGRFLAVSMRNQTVRLWDVDAGQELFDWRPTAGSNNAPFSPRHLAFTADSHALAVPDPAAPVLHLLDLERLNRQLADTGLSW
jgi:serine/threonine protein kinase/WD40 repeat protein